jgi:hypothetical protein
MQMRSPGRTCIARYAQRRMPFSRRQARAAARRVAGHRALIPKTNVREQ